MSRPWKETFSDLKSSWKSRCTIKKRNHRSGPPVPLGKCRSASEGEGGEEPTLYMEHKMQPRHGGQILIDQLKIQNVPRVFCIPGESYLAALDGLYNSGIDVIIGRQEGGVAMMAAAQGKLTGNPGIAFVTRGPGATNASAGVHIAHQNSIPMILFIGQIGRSMTDREAFQEINYRHMFGDVAKWVAQIDQIERIPEYISHAFHKATSGRQGPVVLALPEDVLSSTAEVKDCKPAHTVTAKASDEDISLILDQLKTSSKPLAIVGGGGWSQEANNNLQTFAENFNIPITASFRRQDYIDNRHPNYVGDVGIGKRPQLTEMIETSDLLLLLGARLGEMPTNGYTDLSIPNPKQPLIQVHPDPSELGKVYRADIAINASVPSTLKKLANAPSDNTDREEWTSTARKAYEDWTTPKETPGSVKLEQVVTYLRETLPENAIICNGAGNYAGWVQRYYTHKQHSTLLAPTSGSMGFGLPAAIAAKLERPETPVVCFAGDGCLQMTIQELGTAAQYNTNIIVIVCNNSMYGTIRMHQEKHYPNRTSGTDILNPDFTALAKAYGAYSEKVETTEDFPEAFKRAQEAGKLALLELTISQEAISPALTLSGLKK